MKHIPRAIVEATLSLFPGDTLIVHKGSGWKIEVIHKASGPVPESLFSLEILKRAFDPLANNWVGNIVFQYDFALQRWAPETHTYKNLTAQQEDLVLLP